MQMHPAILPLILASLLPADCRAGKVGKFDLSDVYNPDPTFSNEPVMAEFEGEVEGGLVEGDMRMRNRGGRNRNAQSDEDKKWPQGIVPYTIHSSLTKKSREKLPEAIADFDAKTCVRFVPREDNEVDYVQFTSEHKGCWAEVGRIGGRQTINLENGCDDKGTHIHEMMHAIGFHHEQSRSDRDQYIRVFLDRLPPNWHDAHRKLSPEEEDNMGFPYDFSSLMHYPAFQYAFADRKNSIETIDPKNQNKIGQRAGFSNQDIEEVNTYYQCSTDLKSSNVGGKNGCLDTWGHDFCKGGLSNCNRQDMKENCQKSCKLC